MTLAYREVDELDMPEERDTLPAPGRCDHGDCPEPRMPWKASADGLSLFGSAYCEKHTAELIPT